MEFICYPKCSTCQKALKHLQSMDIDIQMRHIVEQTPTKEELINWIHLYGQGIKPFFNTSGKVYREMNIKDKITSMSVEEAASLLSQNGMLIKRPLLIVNDKIIIGYKKEVYDLLKNKD